MAAISEKLLMVNISAGHDDTINKGVDPIYHLKRLGEFAKPVKTAMLGDMSKGIYQESIRLYPKFYTRYKNEYTKRLDKAIRSFDAVITEHEGYIADPSIKLGNNTPDVVVKRAIEKWREDIERNSAYKAIIQGILDERKNGKTN